MKKVQMHRRAMRRAAPLLAALSLAAMLAGCGMFGPSKETAKWSQVTLSATDDVNNNTPVAVDIVLVSDPALLARIAELPASKWFAGREDFVRTYPKDVRYRSWEMVPGFQIDVRGDDAFAGPRVSGAFVFANYQDPGAHRVRIEKFSGHMVVQLNSSNLTVTDSK
jgi:type VI secretion system protein